MVIKYNGYFYVNEKCRFEIVERTFLRYFDIKKDVTLNLLSLGKKEISKENKKAFNRNSVTDVITLPIYSNLDDVCSERNIDGFVGDILIYRPEIRKNTLRYGKSMIDELELVIVHGMLHLFGFSHDDEKLLNYHQNNIIKKVQNES
jgi:rRNA maturation RNase YbeY